eukprot:2161309-Rhodomonas_salina.1
MDGTIDGRIEAVGRVESRYPGHVEWGPPLLVLDAQVRPAVHERLRDSLVPELGSVVQRSVPENVLPARAIDACHCSPARGLRFAASQIVTDMHEPGRWGQSCTP